MVSKLVFGGLLALTLGVAGTIPAASATTTPTPAPSASCVTLTDALDDGVNADAFDTTEDCNPATVACPPGQDAKTTRTVATKTLPAKTVTTCVAKVAAAPPTPTPMPVPKLEAPKLETPTLPPLPVAPAPAPVAPAVKPVPVPEDPTEGKTSTPVQIPAPAPAAPAATQPKPVVSQYAAGDPVAPKTAPQAQKEAGFPTGLALAAGGVAIAGWILLGRRRKGAAEEPTPAPAEETPQP